MPRVRMSGTDIRAKEVILVCLALALLVFSVSLFFKHWRKNYWDINQLPYYAYLYKVQSERYQQTKSRNLEGLLVLWFSISILLSLS